MKNLSIIILTGLLLADVMSKLEAYELPVHARMTNEAYKKSVLADPQFLNRFGLENDVDPFGTTYYDYQVSDGKLRNGHGICGIKQMTECLT